MSAECYKAHFRFVPAEIGRCDKHSPRLRHGRSPGRDDARRVAVPRKPLRQPAAPGERVWVQVVGLGGARPEFPGRFGEVDDRLAFDLALVAAVAPMAEVERLVAEPSPAETPPAAGNPPGRA